MRTNLTLEDQRELLDRAIVAVLATYRADGAVLLSPVWHEFRDGGFNVWVFADTVKVRHVRRDPRASIVVAESEEPYRGVEVRTRASLVSEGATRTAHRIAGRYLGPEAGAAYVGPESDQNVIIRLEPGDVRGGFRRGRRREPDLKPNVPSAQRPSAKWPWWLRTTSSVRA